MAVLAVLYGFGLLITNQYLSRIGVTDFSSIRPKYVLTGAWGLTLIAAAAFPAIVTWALPLRFRHRFLEDSPFRDVVTLLTATAVTIPLTNGVAILISDRTFDLGSFFLLLVASSGPVFIASRMLSAIRRVGARGLTVLSILLTVCFASVIIIWSLLLAVVYPVVAPSLGGGKPPRAELILNPIGVQFWKEVARPPSSDSDPVRTPPVAILFQDQDKLVILRDVTAMAGAKRITLFGVSAPYRLRYDGIIVIRKSLVEGMVMVHDPDD